MIAGECETSSGGIDLHCTAKGLLCARSHTVGFIEDDELLSASRECDFLLSEGFYAVADDVDSYFDQLALFIDLIGIECVPRSSEAFNSKTASLYASPSNCLARHNMLVVFPIPGIPDIMTCGMFPSFAMILRRSIVSVLPTMSSRKTGRYFSTLQASLERLLTLDMRDSPGQGVLCLNW